MRRGRAVALRPAFSLALFAAVLRSRWSLARPGSGETATPPFGPLPLLGAADSGDDADGRGARRRAGRGVGLPPAAARGRRGQGRRSRASPSAPRRPGRPTRSSPSCATPTRPGWQVFDTPVDEAGCPTAGRLPNRLSARITPERRRRPGRSRHRPAGGRAARRPRPRSRRRAGGCSRRRRTPCCCPPEADDPAEALGEDQGAGAIADAAVDEASHTGLFFGPQGPLGGRRDRPLRRAANGGASRSAVPRPRAPRPTSSILAIDATGLGNAWALAEADPSLEPLGRAAASAPRPRKGRSGSERPLSGIAVRRARRLRRRGSPGPSRSAAPRSR